MKNSKRFLTAVISVLTFVLVGMFAACDPSYDDLTTCKQWIQASQKTVQTVEMTVEMKDSGVTVYAFEKTITFSSDNSAMVKTVESTLNSAFALESKESTDRIENVKRSKLLTIALEREKIDAYDYAENRLSVLVEKDMLDDVFGWESLEATDYVQIAFDFEAQRMTSAVCSFMTATGKSVVCHLTYSY